MLRLAAACFIIVTVVGSAFAHGKKPHDQSANTQRELGADEFVETPFGTTVQAGAVVKTVTLEMSDEMRFSPGILHVQVGDTIRFVATNKGEINHEMVLGRPEDLHKHSQVMAKFPEMEHDEPYMVHVDPSKTGEILWTFSKPGQFEYGCLLPGHYENGMKGVIYVEARHQTTSVKPNSPSPGIVLLK